MKDPGWTLSDLEGELRARGIDINDVPDIAGALNEPTPDRAAERIDAELREDPP